jgi:uncharacterized protein YvpB
MTMPIHHQVTHISQRGKPHENFACGVASFAMLLTFAGKNYEYDNLCKELKVTETPYEKGYSWGSEHLGAATYFEDIIRWLQDRKFEFAASILRTKQNFSVIPRLIKFTPIIVGIRAQSSGHWVVLVGMHGNRYQYLDPWLKTGKRKEISKIDLFDDWDGTCIALKTITSVNG